MQLQSHAKDWHTSSLCVVQCHAQIIGVSLEKTHSSNGVMQQSLQQSATVRPACNARKQRSYVQHSRRRSPPEAAQRGAHVSSAHEVHATAQTSEVELRYAGDASNSSDGVLLVAELSAATSPAGPPSNMSAPATVAAIAGVGLVGLALKAAFDRGSR